MGSPNGVVSVPREVKSADVSGHVSFTRFSHCFTCVSVLMALHCADCSLGSPSSLMRVHLLWSSPNITEKFIHG